MLLFELLLLQIILLYSMGAYIIYVDKILRIFVYLPLFVDNLFFIVDIWFNVCFRAKSKKFLIKKFFKYFKMAAFVLVKVCFNRPLIKGIHAKKKKNVWDYAVPEILSKKSLDLSLNSAFHSKNFYFFHPCCLTPARWG